MIDKSGDEFGTYIEEILEDTDLIKILDMKESAIETNIQGGKIEFAVIIGDAESENPITVIKAKDSTVATYMEVMLNGAVAKYGKEETGMFAQNEVEENLFLSIPYSNEFYAIFFFL